ncbi:hypothetical protein [Pajaroellobacter abortibovis]|uniref:Uncharacterized protein n=1 Tax=Pajaroellobacter abortibovis TaxID=1882918 RepID=A0A1L6MX10_9BACT|nr:hypothetical protein [Pajaroellobacter abortibovis]APR99947.1 hypothetical protein BCY86_04065 [Pajaroellobacter abortibovis]
MVEFVLADAWVVCSLRAVDVCPDELDPPQEILLTHDRHLEALKLKMKGVTCGLPAVDEALS